MELLQLRYFLALSKTESIAITAKKLYISSPSLSLTISKLEKELGIALFDRTGNRLKLNENGILFAEHIEEALNKIDAGVGMLAEKISGKSVMLSVATTSPTIWNNLFIAFNKENPNIIIVNNILSIDELNSNSLDTRYDFIITCPTDFSYEKDISSEKIYDDDYPVLLVSKSHPLSSKKEIKFQDVRNEHFIALTKGSSSRKLFDDFCLLAGIKPKIIFECDYIMRSKMVQNNIGVAMATARIRMDDTYPNISIVNIIDPKFNRRQFLFWSKRKKLTTAAMKFKTFIIDYFLKHPISKL